MFKPISYCKLIVLYMAEQVNQKMEQSRIIADKAAAIKSCSQPLILPC